MKIKILLYCFIFLVVWGKRCNGQYGNTSHGACNAPQITSVSINTLNASNTCTGSSGYNYYTPIGSNTTTLLPGQSYTLAVTVSSNAIGSVWFDFDGNISLDNYEWTQLGNPFNGTTSVVITVPSNTAAGITRMRIRTSAGSSNGAGNAYSVFNSGETEDYDITIGSPLPPPILGPLPTIASVNPILGEVGILDTINGSNFSTNPANNIVSYGTVRAQVISASPNQLIVSVPSGLSNKPISIMVNGLTVYSSKVFQPTFTNQSSINTNSFAKISDDLYPYAQFTQATPVDFDNNGIMDIVAVCSGGLYIFRNIGSTSGLNPKVNFAPPIVLNYSSLGTSFIIADIDGDGNQDIVSPNINNNTITIIRNNALKDNPFNPYMFSLACVINTDRPYGVVANDFDKDGKLDLACTNNVANRISIYKNIGYPGFFRFLIPVTYTTGSYPKAITVADIDNDERLDIVVTNSNSGTISIFKNNSINTSLSFDTAINFSSGTTPSIIQAADMDGDGNNDLVVGYSSLSYISIYRNSGSTNSLNFTSLNNRVDFALYNSSIVTGICIGELNGDGKPDIFGTNTSPTNGQFFLQNNSTVGSINSSSLASRVDYSTGYLHSDNIAICDMDNDNRNDIIIGGIGRSGVCFYKNQIGTFRVNNINQPFLNHGASTTVSFVSTMLINTGNNFIAQLSDSSGSFANPMAIGSISTVGSATINITIPQGIKPSLHYKVRVVSTNPVLTSEASLSFVVVVPPTINNIQPNSASPGSIVQISGANFSTNTNENFVYFGAVRARVTSASPNQLAVLVPQSAVDAHVTVTVHGNTATSTKIFTPNFVGNNLINASTLGAYISFAAGNGPMSIDLVDLQLDGRPDIVIAQNGGSTSSTNRIFNNQGGTNITTATFSTPVAITAPGLVSNTQIVDLDGDGQKDIISICDNTPNLSIWKNVSMLNVVEVNSRTDLLLPSNASGVSYGDVNLDGKIDVATVNFNTNNVSIFRNLSRIGELNSNSFATRIDMAVTPGASFVGLEDLDLDKKADLIVISTTSVNATVYLNTSANGSISFASGISFPLHSTPRGFVFGDLNNDGKPELLVTNANNVVSIFENLSGVGMFSFGQRIDLTTGNGPVGVTTGDIDGNGKSDIVVANQLSGTISIIANNSPGSSISSINFASKVDFSAPLGSQPNGINVCDIDGNLKPDILVSLNNSSSFIIFPNNTSIFSTPFAREQMCLSSTFSIPYFASLAFNSGNIFSAQLSDSSGSFASPLTIGTLVATSSGSISGTIPSNTPIGPGYRIRIVSSNPVLVSSVSLSAITINKCPVINSISSQSGEIGTTVTISGANFSTKEADNIVYFGAVKALISSVSSTSITTSNPIGNNLKDVTVTTLENNLTANKNLRFNTTFVNNSNTFSTSNFGNIINLICPGSSPRGVSTADFDGDGLADIVGVATLSNTITVYRNTNTVNGQISELGFNSSSSYSIPSASAFVKTGDLDGDGKIDIVVFCYNGSASGGSSVSIFKNISSYGTINFESRVDLVSDYSSNAYAGDIVDLDNDGKPDIITVNGSTTISIFKNNCQQKVISAGSFSRTNIFTTFSVKEMNHADFDSDGLNDLIFTGRGNAAYILRNSTGVIEPNMFSSTFSISTGSGALSISTCDLNFDNKPDIAIACITAQTVTIYRNNYSSGILTSSSFISQTTLMHSPGSYGIVPVDIDGDNKVDLVNSSDQAGMIMYKNTTPNSGGTITFNPPYYSAWGNFLYIDVADFNSDGKLDIIGANHSSNAYTIFQNTSPTFSVSSVGNVPYCSGTSLTISYNLPSSTVNQGNLFTAQLSDSSGSFSNPTNIGAVSSITSGSITATIPNNIPVGNNYKIRIISSNPIFLTTNSTPLRIMSCQVITNISVPTSHVGSSIVIDGSNFSPIGSKNIVHFGSVKSNVISSTGSQLHVAVPSGALSGVVSLTIGDYTALSQQAFFPTFSGDGSLSQNSFSARSDVLKGLSGVRGAVMADFDNDGKPDYVTSISNSSNINVYRNISNKNTIDSSSFAAPIILTSNIQPWTQLAADFNNDGLLDIASINLGSNTLCVFKNTTMSIGNISFAPKVEVSLSPNSTAYGMAAGDIDRDGLLDLVVSNRGLGTISIYKNQTINGVIRFSNHVSFNTPSQPVSVIVAEFDGDGKPDIATANFGSNTISVFRNISSFGFINSLSLANRIDIVAGSGPFAIFSADIDGDNRLDLMVPSSNSNNLYIYRNTSTSSLIGFNSSIFSSSGSVGLNCITTGDLDGDGKQDIISTNAVSNNITIYKNNSTVGNISLSAGFNLGALSGLSSACINDFDGDDRPDIFVTCSNSNTVSVFRNITLAPEPTINAASINVTQNGNNSLLLRWTNGNGSKRIVLARPLTPVNATPTDEITYSANNVLGLGAQIGSGNYVVYDDTGTFVNVTGLNPLTQYYFRIFEYNGIGSTINYLITGISSTSGSTLPVSLISLTAQELKNKIQLSWTTVSELNNSHFEVERSYDNVYFTKIGDIAGSGNSNTIKKYIFIDEHPFSQINYYKLKQVDFNSEYMYSNCVMVKRKGLENQSTILVFPNPANTHIIVEGLFEYGFLYDAMGHLITIIKTDGQIDISTLISGMYCLKSGANMIKFIKQ